jgi:hypothetical protein
MTVPEQAGVKKGPAIVRTERDARSALPPDSPPAVWVAFATQAAWKSWAIVALLALSGLFALAAIRLASRPPEYVLVDAAGRMTAVRRSVATDALLSFLAERTRPPEMAIVRFTRDFLHLALALNSTTIEANWPQALAMMSPELRARIAAEAGARKLIETYKRAQRRTDLVFEEVALEDRTPTLLTVRATLVRRIAPLFEGNAAGASERVQIELVLRVVVPTMEQPDGLEVTEWRFGSLPDKDPDIASGAGTQEDSHASK